ncbi:MAG: CPBP family intramembrane metalloprotease [Oscillospiraceae bacterium]|nr:CPBP family intramembrane metalloprotease [Oscillospiraceae bacterium]
MTDLQKRIRNDIYIVGAVFCGNAALKFIVPVIIGAVLKALQFNPQNAPVMTYILNITISVLINYALPLIMFGYLFRNKKAEAENVLPFKAVMLIPLFLAAYFATLTGGIVSSIFIKPTPFELPESSVQKILFYFLIIIIAPVCEELIFRKMLLTPLRKAGDLQAIIFTSVFFALSHGSAGQILYAFLGGLVLGFIAVRTNNITISIIIHMMINGFELFRMELIRNNVNTDIMLLNLFVAGAAAVIFLIIRRFFKLKNNCPEIPRAERLKLLYYNPLLVLSVALLIIVMGIT